jgi:hypothetical protein
MTGFNNGAIGLGLGSNYDILKSMVLDEMKKEAEQK